jgi:hypothetical protein
MIEVPKIVMLVVLVGLTVLAGMILHRFQTSDNKFDLKDLLMKDGRASISKCGQFAALCVSTWAFVFLTISNHLSEAYFTLYMATWAGAKFGDKALDIYAMKNKDAKP